MSSWYDTLTSTPVLIAGALGITAAVYASNHTANQAITQVKEVTAAAGADTKTAKMAQAVCFLYLPGHVTCLTYLDVILFSPPLSCHLLPPNSPLQK